MHIVHVSPSYAPCVGGAERLLQNVSERLVDRGHSVTVLTFDCATMRDFNSPRGAGLPRRELPPFETTQNVLAAAAGSEAPRIVSPRAALVYTLRATDRNRQSIPLRADTAAGVRTVYWFAGKQFIGASAPVDPVMWKPSPGSWKIQALDDHGRTASCMVKVEMVE